MIGRRNRNTATFLFLCAVICSCPFVLAADSANVPDAAYQQSFDKWKADTVDDLKKNWLPLAGLFWLKPGESSFGSAGDNVIVFPKGPAHAGVFMLQNGDVSVKLLGGAHALVDGEPVAVANLRPDVVGKPTVVEMGSLHFHVVVRGQRIGIRLKDLDSEAVKNYRGPIFFPIDLSYRINATWIPSDGKQSIDVPNVLGDITPTPIPGIAVFKLNGQEFRLTALSGDPSKGMSFVFSDLTSKTETYPGGRFLDTGPITDGIIVLDFNRAYNPPCSVTPYATCPLAPKENRLTVAIPAGEKYDHAHGHH